MDLTKVLNSNHSDFFKSSDPLVLFYGSAGSGKSYSAADKLLLQPLIHQAPVRMTVLRRALPSLKKTCLPTMQGRAKAMRIPFEVNQNEMTGRLPYGGEVIFLSCNTEYEVEKLKSLTDIDIAWIEEGTEVPESAFDQLRLRLRGGQLDWKQTIVTFNPVSRNHWLYRRFVEAGESARIFRTTYRDNPWLDQAYIDYLQSLKDTNPFLYKVYTEGEWGDVSGTIFTNWDIVDEIPEGEVIYGIDWGWTHPSAVVKCTIKERDVYLEEVIHQSQLTNDDLKGKMQAAGIKGLCYYDTAEPARAEALTRSGFTMLPADKSSVYHSIIYMQGLNLHIHAASENLIKEFGAYAWKKDRDGNETETPVTVFDDGIKAATYALFTHRHRHRRPKKPVEHPNGLPFTPPKPLRQRSAGIDPMSL